MTRDFDTLTRNTRDLMKGRRLILRVSSTFGLRARIACWLIGLAGRVINVPCEIEIARADGAET